MSKNNYFIKLLMLSVNNELILLYGFSSITNQKEYTWKEKRGNGIGLFIWKSIMNEEDADEFFNKLKLPGKILLNEKEFISPELFERQTVLYNDGLIKEQGPIDKCKKLIELWEVDKKSLFEKIKVSIASTESNKINNYRSIKELFMWINSESGVNMFNDGKRLGNFEIFYPLDHENDFQINTYKEYGLKKTTIKKVKEFNNNLIVNCISTHRMKTICNKTKNFLPEESSLEFTSNEPMSEVLIQIWNENNGELIFSENYTLMLNISMNLGFVTPTFRLRDNWTNGLINSALNRKEYIEDNIEIMSYVNHRDTISVKSGYENELDFAIEEGLNISSIYKQNYIKGSFAKNENKDGEIESFIKIREYIENTMIDKVVIVDPYFSVLAAEKILTRISRRDIEIIIITALDGIDPDYGKKSNENQANKLQNFLENNSQLIYYNLKVINLSRTKRQPFHDRYLLRHYNNGSMDGFLLSNSINSMGQYYPFVMAAMDYELCLEVSDYLDDMIQKAINEENKSIKYELLYYSKNKLSNKSKEKYESLPNLEWFNKWKNNDDAIKIPFRDIQETISIILEHWDNNSELACKALCSLDQFLENGCPYKLLAEAIENNDELKELFLNELFKLSEQIESPINHTKKGLMIEENKLYLLLCDKAKINSSVKNDLVNWGGHTNYGPCWLRSGYIILLYLSSEKYFDLMDKLKSPMMFDILIQVITSHNFNNEFYLSFIEKGNINIQIFFADFFFYRIAQNPTFFERYKQILDSLAVDNCIIQLSRMISNIKFDLRTELVDKHIFSPIFEFIINLFAEKVVYCSPEIEKEAMDYLYDSETISHCFLYYEIGRNISNETLKNKFYKNALNISEKGIKRTIIDKDFIELINFHIEILDISYREKAEKELLKSFIEVKDFEIASEPELYNYNYDKWSKSAESAYKQIEILKKYLAKHPDSTKSKIIIDTWEERVYLNCKDLLFTN